MPGLLAADGNINQICILKTINRTAPFNLRDLILLSSLWVLSVDTREPWHVIDAQTRHNLPIPPTVIPAQYLLKKETLLFFQFCSFIAMCTTSRYYTLLYFPLPALWAQSAVDVTLIKCGKGQTIASQDSTIYSYLLPAAIDISTPRRCSQPVFCDATWFPHRARGIVTPRLVLCCLYFVLLHWIYISTFLLCGVVLVRYSFPNG